VNAPDLPLPAESSQLDADLAALDAAELELAAVDAALARLDEGTYGVCRLCGRRLDDEVLAQAPTADRCRVCG
jgi:DnaK suppressor protein